MKQYIKNCFYAGAIALLPVALTLYFTLWVIGIIIVFIKDSFFIKLMVDHLFTLDSVTTRQEAELYIKPVIYLLSIAGIALSITFIGGGLKFVIGRRVAQFLDRVFIKIPVIKSIYTTINQITKLLSSDKSNSYKKVALIEYPRTGVFSLGFLTSDIDRPLTYITKDTDLVNIFIPTSPNPTSGMFVMVPRSEVRFLDMRVEDAVKLIVSGGAVMPTEVKKNSKVSC